MRPVPSLGYLAVPVKSMCSKKWARPGRSFLAQHNLARRKPFVKSSSGPLVAHAHVDTKSSSCLWTHQGVSHLDSWYQVPMRRSTGAHFDAFTIKTCKRKLDGVHEGKL